MKENRTVGETKNKIRRKRISLRMKKKANDQKKIWEEYNTEEKQRTWKHKISRKENEATGKNNEKDHQIQQIKSKSSLFFKEKTLP